MKELRAILVGCAISINYGCAMFPSTPNELIENTKHTDSYCYDQPAAAVAIQIEALLVRCYGPGEAMVSAGDTYVPVNFDEAVVKEELGNKVRYSISNPLAVPFSSEIEADVEGCGTKVTVYGMTSMWKRIFDKVDQAAQGQAPKC